MAIPSLRLGWVGLGSMGNAMAKNIHAYLQSHHDTSLSFYNRTPSRGDALEALGGERCASVSELATRSDVVFISASDDAAVESIVEQIISSGSELTTKIIVDTTTTHPNTTKQMAEKLVAQGAQFAAMPVFGATPVAEQGKLLVAFAGPESVYETIAPFLKGVVAREVLQVGKEPEKAMLLKTTGCVVAVAHQTKRVNVARD
ncbi:hypothetical protein RRF57_002790 [Xylaria bambusicola]|uniref:6-phosphogluconate dehydrogenase NADP-binding domain-containing protein n=1 Tax=Xylaria bambusicola TaxID=326684 RepID=A0AAN7U6U7_9PEZI